MNRHILFYYTVILFKLLFIIFGFSLGYKCMPFIQFELIGNIISRAIARILVVFDSVKLAQRSLTSSQRTTHNETTTHHVKLKKGHFCLLYYTELRFRFFAFLILVSFKSLTIFINKIHINSLLEPLHVFHIIFYLNNIKFKY